MKIATVITAYNEGAEVAATVASMAESMRGKGTGTCKGTGTSTPLGSLSPSSLSPSELLIVVVDDGSTDGSCEGLGTGPLSPSGGLSPYTLRVVRHDKPQGVGRARNAGLAVALQWGADVVSFHDGHMRFPEGVMEALAAKALESPAIVTSKAKGWWFGEDHPQVKAGKVKAGDERPFRAWGADMHWNSGYGLQPKYRIYAKPGTGPRKGTGTSTPLGSLSPPVLSPSTDADPGHARGQDPNGLRVQSPEWARVPCPMGACYVFGRRAIERLMAPTGRLWDDVAGRWGFSEQAIAVKAFLLDIPVLVSRDLATHHHYRNANPVPNAGVETWKNVCWSMAALLSDEAFDLRFRDFCDARLGREQARRITAQARDAAAQAGSYRPCDPPREDMIWTHLLGRSAPITEPHPDHAWLAELGTGPLSPSRVLSPSTGPAPSEGDRDPKDVKVPAPLRILQWRPGESTLMLREALPNAEITALEWFPHRTQNWRGLCKRLRVKLHQTTLEAWTNPVQAGFLKGQAPFDLITIGGELAEECRAAAKGLLAQGGRIVVNPTADALQIEDAERRKAGERLKAAGSKQSAVSSKQARRPAANPQSAIRNPQSSVTVVLLNWQRAENIMLLLNCLQQQTARPRVVVWDNGFGEEGGLKIRPANGPMMPIEAHPLVDLAVYSSRNLGCFPRWQLATHCQTEYVCSLDDDLMFKDPRVLADAVTAHRTLCPDGIVGMFGVRLQEGKTYKDARHYNGRVKHDTPVDIVKGRFMLFRREQLRDVPGAIPGVLQAEDDLYVSLSISRGKLGGHLLPGCLSGRWQQVGKEDARSNSLRPGHYKVRDKMVRRLLDYYGQRQPQDDVGRSGDLTGQSEIGRQMGADRLTADH